MRDDIKPRFYFDIKDDIQLKELIAEVEKSTDKKVYVYCMNQYITDDNIRLTSELDSKKPDEDLDNTILNTIVMIVNSRPELIKKILQGKIKMREGGSAKR